MTDDLAKLEQCVEARDTTFDNVVPERLWISTRSIENGKYIAVIAEINGIQKEIEKIYVGSYSGILSSSTQLTWVINKAVESHKSEIDRLKAQLAVAKEALVAIGAVDVPSASDKTAWIVMLESVCLLVRKTLKRIEEME